MTNEPEPNTRAGEAFDPPCTDCGDTGVTFQTERACTCDAATRPLPQPSELVDDDARLILRLAGVVNRLTPGAIERADLDGMAFTVREAEDRIAELSAQIAKLQADGDKLAAALEMIAAGHGCPSALATATLTEWKDRA